MSEVTARNARGLQKIKAFQRLFQVMAESSEILSVRCLVSQTDDLLFIHTKLDRRIYRNTVQAPSHLSVCPYPPLSPPAQGVYGGQCGSNRYLSLQHLQNGHRTDATQESLSTINYSPIIAHFVLE